MSTVVTTRAEAHNGSSQPRRWPEVLALVAALLGAFLLVGWIGAREAARDQRVLGVLDPAAGWMRESGQVWWQWLLDHSRVTGWVTTGTAAAIALAGAIIGRRAAAPLWLLAVTVSLATWGQVELHEDAVRLGTWLYLSGLVCAVGFGIWMPMSRLDGFPTLAVPRRRRRRGAQDPDLSDMPPQAARSVGQSLTAWRRECMLVFGLGVLALLTRVYALPELPRGVDLEMVESMIASRTATGMYWYCGDGFWGNGGGLIHMLPRKFIFDLFGTSVYGVRLSSVFLGVAAVPLLYWLVRRIAGIGPAVVSSVFLIAAPEQLFWSRNENAHFIPIALLTLVCAHLGLWMVQRLSFVAVMAAALWIPFSRLFYTPGSIMFVYPVALYAHALVFVKGAWRKLLYVVPLLALGVTLWFYSFSILYTFAHPGEWRFIDPTTVYGSSAWRKQGEYMHTPLGELVRLQAVSMATNFGEVVKGLVFRTPGFSHWYDRYDISPNHRTTINVGVTLIGILGLGYLIGQIYERRVFMLVVWVILGVVPGIMSTEPADRRISVMFPGLYVVAGVMVGAVVRVVRRCAGRWLSWVTSGVLAIAIAVIALTSMTSHLLIPTGTNFLDGPTRFTAPYFQESDVIYYNFDQAVAEGMLLGNVDQFLARPVPPCFELVAPKDWLTTPLRLRCRFPNRAATLTMPLDRTRAAEAAYRPKRITFLMEDWPHTHSQIDLLRELYPRAQIREYRNVNDTALVALTVGTEDVQALHRPSLVVDPDHERAAPAERAVLAGLPPLPVETSPDPVVEPQATVPEAASSNVVVRGGLLIEEDDWYRLTLRPPCPVASFAIDQRPAPAEAMQPLLAGVHAFEITLPEPNDCRLPLQVLAESNSRKQPVPVSSSDLLSAHVAVLPHARAAPAATYPGYGEAMPLTVPPDTPIDFGVDAEGGLYLLTRGDGWRVHRFDPQGHTVATWPVDLPPDRDSAWLTVDPTGTSIVLSHQTALFYDPNGKLVGNGVDPLIWATDVAPWRDRFLMVRADRPAVDVVSRTGVLLTEWVRFDGAPGRFVRPGAVVVGPDEQIVVVEGDGDTLVFRNDTDVWAPTLVRRFHIDFSELPAHPHGMAFDGPDRLVLPDPPSYNPLVYSLTGERLLAETPARDLSTRGFGIVQRVRHTDDWLYILESARRLWKVAR